MKTLIYFLLTLLFAIFVCGALAEEFTVDKVIDGDTVILSNRERVRLIGVDTTEKSHPLKPIEFFSQEATNFTRKLVEGKLVRLEYDAERRDKYNRLLAYLYLLDGTFVNAEIIKQGYGFAYTKYPFKYTSIFTNYEKEARANKKGYWEYGGKGELLWLKNTKSPHFKVFPMSQMRWGVQYNGYIKTRIPNEDFQYDLLNLRQWVVEFHEDDLNEKLLQNGWELKP